MPRRELQYPAAKLPVPTELVESRIHLLRGRKVMLDGDLADLYQVETRALVQAVKRNLDRFPDDSCSSSAKASLKDGDHKL